jgi:hypothetical protein
VSRPRTESDDPCGKPTDKKMVKLLDEASKAKARGTPPEAEELRLELDGECAECLFQLGVSAYRIGKEGGKGYGSDQVFRAVASEVPQLPQ